jgi:hypothetical protein
VTDTSGTETAPPAPAFEDQQTEAEAEPQQPPQQEPTFVDPENLPANQEPEEPVEPEGSGTTEGVDTPEGGGVLTGTATEQAPGVGGLGDHPAPAAMVDETGNVRVAGQPPHAAAGVAPEGDTTDEQAGGDVTDEEAAEKLTAVQEPEQVETERPDIGTE